MAIHITQRNSRKDTRNCKKNQGVLPDEIALRDEIVELKRQVMILRRTNEQNLVKFRKYEDEAKRKDREIEQLMDPRKNADITKVLSTKGAAILMTLKDQNNALIQMVLNKDVQIKRLLSEMKMSKLYASTKKNFPYKEEILRLKNLLVRSQEKLKENLDKENEARSACANENSVLEFSSSEQSSPRDLDELRLVIRSLETHLKYSNDLLNRKDREISVLTDELNFLKKLFQHKTSKKKAFDCYPVATHKHSIRDTHSVPQTRVSDNIPQTGKIHGAEFLQYFEKPVDIENKNLSSSAPATSTRLSPYSNDFLSKHKSLSNITGIETWTNSKIKPANETTVFHGVTVGKNANAVDNTPKFEKAGRVRSRKKVLMKHREPKKKIPKFSGRSSAKRKKFYENEKNKLSTSMLDSLESEKEAKEACDQKIQESFQIKGSTGKEANTKAEEIFAKTDGSGFDKGNSRTSRMETEVLDGNEKDRTNFIENSDLEDADKKSGIPVSDKYSDRNLVIDNMSEKNSEKIEINLPLNQENSKMYEEETKPLNLCRKIYRQSFDSSFESENGNSMKQEVHQVQVEVQIDSISIQNDGDGLDNFLWENSHQEEFTETKGGNSAPDDYDNNNNNNNNSNDDDNDVIIR